jgi:hypothetical protein
MRSFEMHITFKRGNIVLLSSVVTTIHSALLGVSCVQGNIYVIAEMEVCAVVICAYIYCHFYLSASIYIEHRTYCIKLHLSETVTESLEYSME